MPACEPSFNCKQNQSRIQKNKQKLAAATPGRSFSRLPAAFWDASCRFPEDFVNIYYMEQVLRSLFHQHRRQLVYPQKQRRVVLPAHYKEVQNRGTLARRSIGPPKQQYKSIDLDDRKPKPSPQREQPGFTPKIKFKMKSDLEDIKKPAVSSGKNYNEVIRLPSMAKPKHLKPTYIKINNTGAINNQDESNIPAIIVEKKSKRTARAKKAARKCLKAIIFVIKLQTGYKKKFVLFIEMKSLSQHLVAIITKMVSKYYFEILSEPLKQLRLIIAKKLSQKYYDSTDDIVENLLQFSQALKNSSLRKDLMKFLTYLTIKNMPLPHDFFTPFELLRLDFTRSRFKICGIRQSQIYMIVALFFGVKVICNYIFNQPERLGLPDAASLDRKAKKILQNYSSYFYQSVVRFFDRLPTHPQSTISELEQKGVQPVTIKQSGSQFYNKISSMYQEQHRQTQANLNMWINRIGSEVIRHRSILTNQY